MPRGARDGVAALDIAVAGFGARGRNAEDHQIAGRAREFERGAHQLAIARGVGDVAVRRKHGHQRVAVLVREMNRGEADGCGGVASDRLGQNVRGGHAAQFARTAAACSTFVTDPDISRRNDGARRATVSRSMVSLPAILSSCLGVRMRLRGQKRVPRPPASSTAQAGSDSRFGAALLSWMHQARQSRLR